MAGKIFINYQRGDDPDFAQLLYAHLDAQITRKLPGHTPSERIIFGGFDVP